MLLGRNTELSYLNHYYDRQDSQIVVVYGQKNIGKTALVREFSQDKPMHYYKARSCSEREQMYQWGMELGNEGIKSFKYPEYQDIFKAITEQKTPKKVIIIDEFQNIIKYSNTFMKGLISFVHNQWNSQPVMIILCSSSVGFIENSMIEKIGEAAYELSGLLKIKELSFSDMLDYFPGFSLQQCLDAYGILGGFPGLWNQFNDKLSIKENVVRYILPSNSALFREAEKYVSDELRETGVYNTILASIAAGKHKLNDLYLHTGFSRAKISVYIKNLMELELVEKIFSFDSDGKNNAQKGIYRISNPFVHFYFRFVYPNMSKFEEETANTFYQENIGPTLRNHVADYFKTVCREHLMALNEKGKLPIQIEKCGEWVGKIGNIDIVAQDEKGASLIALCNYEKPMMTYDDYEWLLFCAGKAKISPDYVYLYSIERFDEKLTLEAKVKKNIMLVSMND